MRDDTSVLVVDDALLLALVAGWEHGSVALVTAAVERGEVFTTGCWYWRLVRALSRPGHGALSRVFSTFDALHRQQVRRSLSDLPPEIGLLSFRRLVPVMAALPGQPNLLTAEAVAAAVTLGGSIAVTTRSALLGGIAERAGVVVDFIDLSSAR